MNTLAVTHAEWDTVRRLVAALGHCDPDAEPTVTLRQVEGRCHWTIPTIGSCVEFTAGEDPVSTLAPTYVPRSFLEHGAALAADAGGVSSLWVGVQFVRVVTDSDQFHLGLGSEIRRDADRADFEAPAAIVSAAEFRRLVLDASSQGIREAGAQVRVDIDPDHLAATVEPTGAVPGGATARIAADTRVTGTAVVDGDDLRRVLDAISPKAELRVVINPLTRRLRLRGHDLFGASRFERGPLCTIALPCNPAPSRPECDVGDLLAAFSPRRRGDDSWYVTIDASPVVVEHVGGHVTATTVVTSVDEVTPALRIAVATLNEDWQAPRYRIRHHRVYATIGVERRDAAEIVDWTRRMLAAVAAVRPALAGIEPDRDSRWPDPADAGPPTRGICATCGKLRTSGPDPDRCDCQDSDPNRSAEPQIPSRLCAICGLSMIHGHTRWTRLLCEPCMRDAQALNRAAGRLIVPIGIHSLMNGLGLRADLADDPELLDGFTAALAAQGLAIDQLTRRGAQLLLERCRTFGLDAPGGVYPLADYFDACVEAGIERAAAMAQFVADLAVDD